MKSLECYMARILDSGRCGEVFEFEAMWKGFSDSVSLTPVVWHELTTKAWMLSSKLSTACRCSLRVHGVRRTFQKSEHL